MICHAVYDEAGDTGFQKNSSRYFIGAAVLCQSLRGIERVAWRVRKDARKQQIRLPELKAHLVPPQLVLDGLHFALQWDWQVIVGIVDKHRLTCVPDDKESIYRQVTTNVVLQCLERCSNTHLILDKRYSNAMQRDQLVESI